MVESVRVCDHFADVGTWSMSTLCRSPDLGPAGQPLHFLLGEDPVPPDLGADAVLLGKMPDLAGSDVETLGDLGCGEHCG